MEDMFWKFPHLGNGIIKKLSNQNLAKCKKVGRSWERFIVNEKYYKLKVYYEMEQKKSDYYGNTPLHKAAIDGRYSDCKLIVDHVEEKKPSLRIKLLQMDISTCT